MKICVIFRETIVEIYILFIFFILFFLLFYFILLFFSNKKSIKNKKRVILYTHVIQEVYIYNSDARTINSREVNSRVYARICNTRMRQIGLICVHTREREREYIANALFAVSNPTPTSR